jgi:hypothetical protein
MIAIMLAVAEVLLIVDQVVVVELVEVALVEQGIPAMVQQEQQILEAVAALVADMVTMELMVAQV